MGKIAVKTTGRKTNNSGTLLKGAFFKTALKNSKLLFVGEKMNNKIIKSLLTILIVAAIAVGTTGASFAYFFNIESNGFTAGQIDITLTGAGSQPQDIVATNPGDWTSPIDYHINNLSDSLPVKYMFSSNLVGESKNNFFNQINAKVFFSTDGTSNQANWVEIYNGSLPGLSIDSTAIAQLGELPVGASDVFYMEFQLDPGTGNNWEDEHATFNFSFDATQSNNPGWSQ